MRIDKRLFDSNSTGHMFAAVIAGSITVGLGVLTSNSILIYAGLFVPIYEQVATPDHDHNSRKIRGSLTKRLWLTYWSPFRFGVPHRSRWSHSLLFGTPLRLVYFLLPLFGLCVLHFSHTPGDLTMIRYNPQILLEWGKQYDWIPLAAVIADTTHLFKDGFTPIEMIFGK